MSSFHEDHKSLKRLLLQKQCDQPSVKHGVPLLEKQTFGAEIEKDNGGKMLLWFRTKGFPHAELIQSSLVQHGRPAEGFKNYSTLLLSSLA